MAECVLVSGSRVPIETGIFFAGSHSECVNLAGATWGVIPSSSKPGESAVSDEVAEVPLGERKVQFHQSDRGMLMGTRMTENLQQAVPVRNKTYSDIHKTVRHLLKQVKEGGAGPSPPEAGHEPQEVLLEEEVDGVRYLLVRSQPRPPSAQTSLSPREQEIARMIAKGHPNKVIAAVLDISPWTVSTHLRRIFAKLNVGSRAAMVAHLLEDGGRSESADSITSAHLAALRHKKV